jgi:predicted DNA-binding transcriptional regulator YafY
MTSRAVEVDDRPLATEAAGEGPEAWVLMAFRFPGEGAAVGAILGLGASVEVIEPPAVRSAMLRTAGELAALYGDGSQSGDGT